MPRSIAFILAASAIILLALSTRIPGGHIAGVHDGSFPMIFFFLVIMLLMARVGALATRIGQPAVLGELLAGVLLGAFAFIPFFHGIEELKRREFIAGIAEIGVILLLFRTGLESNVNEMKRIGAKAFLVAVLGVILPFAGGFYAGRWLIPGQSFATYLFIGATLTATSVGITARVFKDLGVLKSKEARIVLGAAVFDDVFGLIVLTVVTGIAWGRYFSIGTIGLLSLKAFVFLIGSVMLGQLLAPIFGAFFSSVHNTREMETAVALFFCGAFAYGASALAGLTPIVGAFAAGLVLDPVHFTRFVAPRFALYTRNWTARMEGNEELKREMNALAHQAEHAHVENLIERLSGFFIPIFFVYTGLQVNLRTFTDLNTLGVALVLTLVAFLGKIACGYAAGKDTNRNIIGFGMVPRGEVGLIFANVGKSLGVVSDNVFTAIIIVVILTTLLTLPIMSTLIKRQEAGQIPAAV
jgi:Kef-type K+ transport system membrane component KefB